MGQVVPSVKAPNLAREVVARHRACPLEVPAHTRQPRLRLRRTGHRGRGFAIRCGDDRGRDRGRGGEPVRRADPAQPRHGAGAGGGLAGRSRSAARLQAFSRVRPRDLVPDAPAIAEPSTGLSMGQSAEKMARENGITREEQDRIALPAATATRPRWTRAARARRCATVRTARRRTTRASTPTTCCARDTSPGGAGRAAARLRPQVRHGHRGQLVAADRRRGRRPADVRGARARGGRTSRWPSSRPWATAAVDPGGQLLMGPAHRDPAGARPRRARRSRTWT